jgi:hypothetical protein
VTKIENCPGVSKAGHLLEIWSLLSTKIIISLKWAVSKSSTGELGQHKKTKFRIEPQSHNLIAKHIKGRNYSINPNV